MSDPCDETAIAHWKDLYEREQAERRDRDTYWSGCVQSLQTALAAARRECEGLRLLLFLRHGCSGPALYGDDGERQCSACGIDFKRQSPEEISARWEVLARAALAAPADGEEGKR